MTPKSLALCASGLALSPHLLFAVPTTNPDTFAASEDTGLTVSSAAGVLSNDSATGALTAVIESDVSNGTLTLNPDGSFTYVPDPDFNGTDSFTYRASESPSGGQVFTLVENSSTASIDAALDVPGVGSDSDSENTTLRGTITAELSPSASPFSQIHITDFDVRTAESVALNFRFAFGLAGVDATAAEEGIQIRMENPGAPSAVDAGGNFSQLQNEARLTGTVSVRGTGLAAGAVPDGPQVFDQAGNFIDLNGTITQTGSTLTLNVPIEFSGDFDLDGNGLGLELDGTLVATSPVRTPEVSSPTTVTINVAPVNDPPVVNNESYLTLSGSPVTVPVTLFGAGDQTLVASGATWRFLDDGSDQGDAWIAPEFDDATWSSGPSQLGYGDSEATLVGFGGDENNKHITTYFRHQFVVPDPEAHGLLCLRLKRDDGAAVYLNGTEVFRSNLAQGAGSTTPAGVSVDTDAEGHFYDWCFPASLLVAGTNTLAVEVHQVSGTSSDLIFDLELIRQRTGGGVLANDSDIDSGDSLTASVHRAPANGTVELATDGSFTYTPNPGFSGTDSFIYEVQDVDESFPMNVIPFADRWRFLDDGSDQGVAWRDPGFDDSGWQTGRGELGYGEDDQATTVSFGGDEANKFATTYFRNRFFLGNVAELSDDVTLRLVRDDAAAIYINGTEVYRDSNLAAGATSSDYATSGVVDENAVVTSPIPLAVLVDGENTVAVEVHQANGTSSDLAFDLAISIESPAAGPVLDSGAIWRYEDGGNDLGSTWLAPVFDDSLWLSGPAELGYGDGDEATALPVPGDPKPITVYFRRTLHVPDASQVQTLEIELVRDDGAAVYLNGTEVLRDNLDDGAAFDTPAAGTANNESESRFRPFRIDPTLLQDGENLIAAEVHQASATSSDLSFNLRVNSSLIASLGVATIEVIGAPFVDTDGDDMDDNWELANGLIVGTDDSALDADGDRRSNLDEFIALTDPQDPTSLLEVVEVARAAGGDLTVRFSSTAGVRYQLQESTDLAGFTDVAGQVLTATGDESSFTLAAAGERRHLRVRVVQ